MRCFIDAPRAGPRRPELRASARQAGFQQLECRGRECAHVGDAVGVAGFHGDGALQRPADGNAGMARSIAITVARRPGAPVSARPQVAPKRSRTVRASSKA